MSDHPVVQLLGEMMKRFFGVALATVILSGSAAASDFDRQVFYGIAVGAGIGAAAGGPIGAAIGGASGGVIAFVIRPDGCYIQNRRGELWQVPCYRPIRGVSACYIGGELTGLRQVSCPWSTLAIAK